MGVVVSIIVCTYSRAELLKQCLQSLADQTSHRSLYEVVIVDNNSTDHTQEVSLEFCAQYENFRVVTERRQGLSFSRNRGWQEARGQYVAYIDDDAKAYPDWCEQIVSFINRQPEIKVFGGPYYPFALTPLPEWFPPEFGMFELGGEERELRIGWEWICGSNMIYRRDLFEDGVPFDTLLGMKGSELSYGEETHLLRRLARQGAKVYYVPAVKVSHLIADYKINLSWLLRSSYARGKASIRTFDERKSIFWHVLRVGKHTVLLPVYFIKHIRQPLKRQLYLAFKELFSAVGSLIGRISVN